MGKTSNRQRKNNDDRQIRIWQPKPRPTLADEVRELNNLVRVLISKVNLLRCDVKEVKDLVSTSSEYSDNLTGEPVTK